MKSLHWGVLVLVLATSGCATMYDSMGIASKDALQLRDDRIKALEAETQDSRDQVGSVASQLSALNDQLAETKDAASRIAAVEAQLKQLEGKVGQLPRETLKQLAAILAQAAEQTAP